MQKNIIKKNITQFECLYNQAIPINTLQQNISKSIADGATHFDIIAFYETEVDGACICRVEFEGLLIDFWNEREETDEEYDARLKQEQLRIERGSLERKAKTQKIIQEIKERELKTLRELKAKYPDEL